MRKPPAELHTFLAPYDAEIAHLFFATRGAVLSAAPKANELIYDAYNTVTAVFSFTDRLTEAFCHVAAYRHYVNLGFNRGARLPDPDELLAGTGSSIRHLRIAAVEDLQRPGLRRLLRAAVQEGRSLSPASRAVPQSIVKAIYARKRRPSSPR
jgi:hypothetical protein